MSLASEAGSLARLLAGRRVRVVFAESCTAGLVAASLARVPGISDFLCGSAVTYRSRTKQDWLGVAEDDLRQWTAVSRPVAEQMACGVLEKTPEADFSASVTGHLGPNAPPGFDGLVFVAVAYRDAGQVRPAGVWRYQLQQRTRFKRQREAAAIVLERLRQCLADAA